jgi:nucleoside-diphosphate-sugar epimerase
MDAISVRLISFTVPPGQNVGAEKVAPGAAARYHMERSRVHNPRSGAELDALLSAPRERTVRALRSLSGDIVVLGAGGKMGPTLAITARKALDAGGFPERRVIAVSRFSSPDVARALQAANVEVVRADLLDRSETSRVPAAANVIFMAGQKFGTHSAPERTWMMNVVLPAICADRYADARIVAFSTGNVYPLVSVRSGGAREADAVGPVGEYAASCVGRERVFGYYAFERGTRVAIMRLNYAIDPRYGVLTDLATSILSDVPIPLQMGYVNVVWQGDANCAALELLTHASSPATTINVTGPAALSVRELAMQLGRRLGRQPRFTGAEADTALLSNTERMQQMLGAPEMPLDTMLDLVAEWVGGGKPVLEKPTHFEARDGIF